MIPKNQTNVTIVNEDANEYEKFKSIAIVSMFHILKTMEQPERFGSSWMRSINNFYQPYKDITNSKNSSYKRKVKEMTISDYKKDIIKQANQETKKDISDDDFQKFVNTFGNRISNLSDREKVNEFLKKMIERSNIPEQYKIEDYKIIDNEKR